jgi:hypothetical protein
MVNPIRLGVIVPSSNTALEPLTQAIVSSISTPERPITVHFTRISVTQLNLSAGSHLQFSHETLLAAGQLLADAKVSAQEIHTISNCTVCIQCVHERNDHIRLMESRGLFCLQNQNVNMRIMLTTHSGFCNRMVGHERWLARVLIRRTTLSIIRG